MSENVQTAVEETAAAEQTSAATAVSGEEQSGGEMPPEERARQASRRRAVEQRARELRASNREERLRQEVLEHPLVKEAMTLLEQTRFKQDLAQVREAYPDLTAESPQDVGEIYCRLMASGKVDPVVAYEAQAAANRRRNPVPQDMVSARSVGGAAMYYSSQELDRLTERDLRDPNIFKKAMVSLSKLKG
jgi:hypothetical protein